MIEWGKDAKRGAALIGHVLHFPYSDILEMDIQEFVEFIQEAQTLWQPGQMPQEA